MNKKTVATLLFLPAFALADDEIPTTDKSASERRVQVYHTPREKRDAGLGTNLTDWLSLSGLAKIEATSFDNNFQNKITNSGQDNAVSAVQVGLKLEMSDQVESEIILDFQDNKTGAVLDEAFVELKSGHWGLSVGKQTLPFGNYYSHFITSPLLEFGETHATALLVGYNYNGVVDVSAFTYKGRARQSNVDERINDWAAAVEAKTLGDRVLIGASYLSDLADTDAQLLENFDNQYPRRVGAWSAYAVVRAGTAEVSLEIVRAARAFRALAPTADQPRAWNLEIAYYPAETWQVAARIERSAELSNQPERRYGIAATWLAYGVVTMSVEALRSDFKPGFAFDNNGNEVRRQTLFATQLSLEF